MADFEEIDLQPKYKTPKDNARVMICQLRYDEKEWKKNSCLLVPIYNSYKIIKLLEIAKENKVDLIVFPELSISEKMIHEIKWDDYKDIIIVGGSHYDDNGINKCPVFIDGIVNYTEKKYLAPDERFGKTKEGSRLLKFKNSKIGNFGILICIDLQHVKNDDYYEDIDILCVPSFNNASNDFHQRMSIICKDSKYGIFCLYSNFINQNNSFGKSALFGIIHHNFHKTIEYSDLLPEEKYFEFDNNTSYAILDLNLKEKRPFANKNKYTNSNISLFATDRISKTIPLNTSENKRYIELIGELSLYLQLSNFDYIISNAFNGKLDVDFYYNYESVNKLINRFRYSANKSKLNAALKELLYSYNYLLRIYDTYTEDERNPNIHLYKAPRKSDWFICPDLFNEEHDLWIEHVRYCIGLFVYKLNEFVDAVNQEVKTNYFPSRFLLENQLPDIIKIKEGLENIYQRRLEFINKYKGKISIDDDLLRIEQYQFK